MSQDHQHAQASVTGVTVWLVSADGGLVEPAVFWERGDADAYADDVARPYRGASVSIRGLVVRGERRRCRLCGEPIVLDDPADPESWCHAEDANDLGDHTADP